MFSVSGTAPCRLSDLTPSKKEHLSDPVLPKRSRASPRYPYVHGCHLLLLLPCQKPYHPTVHPSLSKHAIIPSPLRFEPAGDILALLQEGFVDLQHRQRIRGARGASGKRSWRSLEEGEGVGDRGRWMLVDSVGTKTSRRKSVTSQMVSSRFGRGACCKEGSKGWQLEAAKFFVLWCVTQARREERYVWHAAMK